MKLKVLVFAVLLMATATGCMAPKLVRGYEGEPKPISEVAVLKGVPNERYRLTFTGYMPLENTETFEFENTGNAFTGYSPEVHLLPGKYVIMTHCAIGTSYAFPSLDVDVAPGITYELTCGPSKDSGNTVVLSVVAVKPTEQAVE